ncbi:MAG TPA: right-handed parallel beta-helix repeat-containing protein [Prosthecobacter sp.]
MRLFAFLTLVLFLLSFAAQAEPPPIQQWIDEAIQAGGGVVTLPEGEHELPAGLILKNAQKLALRGVSKERCVLKLTGKAGAAQQADALLTISGSAHTVEIANLTLEGASDAGVKIAQLIRADGTSSAAGMSFKDIAIRDCIFQNFTGTAVLLSKVEGGSVERCSFRDGGQAVEFHQGSQNCTARGNQIIRTRKAFDLLNASACVLVGNESRECGIAATVSNEGAALKNSAHILRNNHFSGAFLEVRPNTTPLPLLENNEGLTASPAQ